MNGTSYQYHGATNDCRLGARSPASEIAIPSRVPQRGEGLGAVGLFLHRPPKRAGYRQSPRNSVTFASIGIDGIHFGSITDDNQVDPNLPIAVTIPMAFKRPNFIVGESLYDFLCLGCTHGFSNLGNLQMNFEATLDYYANPLKSLHRLKNEQYGCRHQSNIE